MAVLNDLITLTLTDQKNPQHHTVMHAFKHKSLHTHNAYTHTYLRAARDQVRGRRGVNVHERGLTGGSARQHRLATCTGMVCARTKVLSQLRRVARSQLLLKHIPSQSARESSRKQEPNTVDHLHDRVHGHRGAHEGLAVQVNIAV